MDVCCRRMKARLKTGPASLFFKDSILNQISLSIPPPSILEGPISQEERGGGAGNGYGTIPVTGPALERIEVM